MSRTIKGAKGPGYEWWARRAVSCRWPSRYGKLRTNRLERHRTHQAAHLAALDRDDEHLHWPVGNGMADRVR